MKDQELKRLIEKYKLSEDEHDKILEILKKELFKGKTSEDEPSMMFVIGQPGSGKTTFIEKSDLSKYTIINSDNYRKYNKYSKEILDKYPIYYAKLTNYDAHLLGDELFLYAVSNKYSVLREKAPTDFSLLGLLKLLNPYEYEVIINVIVTGNLTSLLATRERYEKEILESNTAKLSNIEAHNKCYQILPEFIGKCIKFGLHVNYIIPTEDSFKIIPVREDYLKLLENLREESNKETLINYENRIQEIKMKMIKRNAPQDQFDELDKIDNIYLNIKNNK
ncbi:MAG: zeta toxin family protein [Erysipelotrichales bacterium]|nr:zeta toxin family protein [Erysipelotrichales bacterium]